ncbi:MAG: hypothetical protein GY768_02160 [Planctomycetaceae bacterium]|nr:hypothetical protein [Planctomycetaceae bacterium]
MMPRIRPAMTLILFNLLLAQAFSSESSSNLQYSTPKLLGNLENDKIAESSGLAASNRHRGIFWTHNDSGDKPRLFAFDRTGKHAGTSALRGAQAIDWEDMGTFRYQDRPFLFVADTGCNDLKRRNYTIYTALEPKTPKKDSRVVHRIDFSYADKMPHNCEAVAYDSRDNQFLLIEKRKHHQVLLPSPVWQLNWDPTQPIQTQIAQRIGEIRFPIVTGLDLSPDGSRGFAITYLGNGAELKRRPGESWQTALQRPLRTISLPPRRQGEAVCYGNDGKTLFLTSEKKPSPLYVVPITENTQNR